MPPVGGRPRRAAPRRRVPVRPSPAPRAVSVPRPEAAVGPPRRTAPRASQPAVRTNLRQPLAPLPFQGPRPPALRDANRQTRRAVKALPPSRALPRQPDIAFTPQQRAHVKRTTTLAIKKFAARQGVAPQQAVQILQQQGGSMARKQLSLYRRAYDEDRAVAFRSRTRMTTGSVRGDSKALAYFEKASQARPQPGPRSLKEKVIHVARSGGPGLYLAGEAGKKVSERFHTQLNRAGVGDSLMGNLLRDAVDLPAQAIPSLVYAVNNPRDAAKQFVKDDPLALVAQGKFKEAAEAARAHPGIALTEVVPAVRALDAGAGFVARGGRRPGVRMERTVPGTGLTEFVREPRGLVAGKMARSADRKNVEDIANLREKAREQSRQGNFDEARRLRAVAAVRDRSRLPEGEIRRRVDDFQAQAESRRRQDAAALDQELPEFKGRGEESVALVRTQAIAKAGKDDLNAMLGELQHQFDHGDLTPPQKNANRELQTRIGNYLEGKEQDFAAIESKAQRYAAVVNPITERLIDRGMLTTDSAKYVPFAVRNAGFRHSAERLRSPEYIAHLDAKIAAGKATAAEKKLRRQYEAARRASLRQQYIAERAVAGSDRRIIRDAPETGPVIHGSEASAFTRQSKVKDPVYSVRSAETARSVQTGGLDPGRARHGVFGAGTYVAVGKADRNYSGSAVPAAVDIRKPLVIDNDTAAQQMRPFREAAQQKTGQMQGEAVAKEITRQIRAKGYDSVIVRGAGHAGQDWVVVFDKRQIRTVTSESTVSVGNLGRGEISAITREHGVRLHAVAEEPGRSVVRISGARAATDAAAAKLAEASGGPVRIFHELDGGDGVAYYVDGKFLASRAKVDLAEAERLKSRYGDRLEAVFGDVRDIEHGAARTQSTSGVQAPGNQGASRSSRTQPGRSATLGTGPRPVLARLERVRANEALLERQLKKAQETAKAAQQRANELKPPKGSRYLKPGFAPPHVAERLTEMNRLREEARLAREAGDNPTAIYKEKVAAAIRDEVERMPAPRLTGPEFIQAVTDKMIEQGYDPRDIAFVTQAPQLTSAGAFFVDWTQRRGISGPHRTGEATIKGAIPSHEGILRENARRLQSLVSADENFTAFIAEFALRKDARPATFRTAGEARDAARRMMFDRDGNEIAGAYEWSVIRINPWLGRQEQLRALLDEVDSQGLIEGVSNKQGGNAMIEAVQDALDTSALADDAPGPFALVPNAASSQLLQHTKVLNPSDGWKVLRFLNSSFRRTVLATSVPWITGNIVEGLLRAGIERAGPNSYRRMKQVLAVLEDISPPLARELERRAFGGGQANLVEKGTIYTAAEQFRESNPALRKLVFAAAMVRRTPGIKQVGDLWKAYTDWVFHSANRGIEARIQMAIGGRKLFPEYGTITKQAVEDAARGLTNTSAQVELAGAVTRAYGKYDGFGPFGRQVIQLYTPFAAWSLNALKFLGDVLPNDHPALTAAIAASYNASKEWREDQGMSHFIDGALPGFLQGTYPVEGGRKPLSRYTPFGIAADFPGNFAGLILPQYHGALYALDGLDWKGQRIKDEDGNAVTDPLKLTQIAVFEFAKASVPIAGQAQRFIESGGDPNVFSPFRTIGGEGGSGGRGGNSWLPDAGSSPSSWSPALPSGSNPWMP